MDGKVAVNKQGSDFLAIIKSTQSKGNEQKKSLPENYLSEYSTPFEENLSQSFAAGHLQVFAICAGCAILM